MTSYELHLIFLVICALIRPFLALHVTGKWDTENVYTFLAKFAFQKTEVDEIETTRGYIFGNVTDASTNFNSSIHIAPAMLVIVDGEYVTDLYGNASRPLQFFGDISDDSAESLWRAETARCRAMFSRINDVAWHRKCQPKAKMDFLRQVPCTTGGFCAEEDDRTRVIPGSQFTFTVQDRRQPRYWYLSLIACWRNETTCEWETSALPRPGSQPEGGQTCMLAPDPPVRGYKVALLSAVGGNATNTVAATTWRKFCLPTSVDYDIWMVNGVPRLQDFYRFEHQFSFEDHDIFEMFLVFGLLYFFLSVIFHIKYKGEFGPLAVLLFAHIWLSFTAAAVETVHLAIFSFDGHGVPQLRSLSGVVRRSAEAMLLILLLTTADVGFPIFPAELAHFDRKVRRYRKRVSFRQVNSSVFGSPGDDGTRPLSPERDLLNPDNESREAVENEHRASATWTAGRTKGFYCQRDDSVFTNGTLHKASVGNTPLFLINDEQPVKICGLISCTKSKGRRFLYLITMLFIFISLELGLYIWALVDRDPVLDISVWNTTPGRLLVAARLAVSIWFLSILRNHQKSNFANFNGVVEPLHFAAGFLLWLLSLPAIVFIAETSISPLWRKKTVISVTYFFDFVASVLFVQLINRSNSYASGRYR